MIVGLGCVAHDSILFTEATLAEGKGRVARRETRFGGNVRTALATSAALGVPAAYLACLGTGPTSDDAVVDLREHGVDGRFIGRWAGADPLESTIVVASDGERYIAFDDGPLDLTPLPNPETVARALAEASCLIVDASTSPPGTADVVHRAREMAIPVVLDAERFGRDPGALTAMLAVADHPVLPLHFARQVTGCSDAVAAAEALWSEARSTLVLTDGASGSYFRSGVSTELVFVPAYRVEARDTNGCGDVFHGAYAAGLVRGWESERRVRFANAAAAVVAALPPGTRRVPTVEAIAALDASLLD